MRKADNLTTILGHLSRNLGTLISWNALGTSGLEWDCFVVTLDALISQIYFWNRTLHVSDNSSSRITTELVPS